MSTTAPTVTIDTARPGIGLGRLTGVEIRKLADTRAGLWLFIVTAGLIALVMGLVLLVLGLNDDVTITASGWMQAMTIPVSILLPVFAILTITTEWGQRTNLVTFTLEPRRGRVLAAKLIAVSVLALATIVIAVVLGALGNVLYGAITGHDVVWNVEAREFFWTVVVQLAFFLMAFAIASVFLSTPAAIAVFYVVALILPIIVYPILLALFSWAQDLLPWIDFNYAAAPLVGGVDMMGDPVDVGTTDYLRFLFTLGLWVVLPGVIGGLRVLRSEVK